MRYTINSAPGKRCCTSTLMSWACGQVERKNAKDDCKSSSDLNRNVLCSACRLRNRKPASSPDFLFESVSAGRPMVPGRHPGLYGHESRAAAPLPGLCGTMSGTTHASTGRRYRRPLTALRPRAGHRGRRPIVSQGFSSVERDLSLEGQRPPDLNRAGGRLLLDRDRCQLELLSRQFDHRLKGGLRFARSHKGGLAVRTASTGCREVLVVVRWARDRSDVVPCCAPGYVISATQCSVRSFRGP